MITFARGVLERNKTREAIQAYIKKHRSKHGDSSAEKLRKYLNAERKTYLTMTNEDRLQKARHEFEINAMKKLAEIRR